MESDFLVREAERIVRERQEETEPLQECRIDLSHLTWRCEVCGYENDIETLSICQNCGSLSSHLRM